MDAKRFGAFISERRKKQHMTQADLAGKIGVTDKAVSRWERGLGFPDINTMEPLAEALDVSLLELMRSEMQTTEGANVKKDEAAEKDGTVEMNEAAEKNGMAEKREKAEKKYTSAEVTEMMQSMEEIRKQQQHQDKTVGYLVIPVILIIMAVFKFSGHANLGGSVFAGLLGAGAAVSGYYLYVNREDKESRRIYGFFAIVLTGIFLTICSLLLPDGFWEQHKQGASLITCLVNLAVIIYAFGIAVKKMYKEKKNLVLITGVVALEILIVAWILHGFAARSIEDAMGTSKGVVAEQYAAQLLINEKNLEEDWIRGYSYVQIDLHPDIYRVGFSYYADQKDAEVGKESLYGYDIQVDSDYEITIQDESTAIGEDLWSENIEG